MIVSMLAYFSDASNCDANVDNASSSHTESWFVVHNLAHIRETISSKIIFR